MLQHYFILFLCISTINYKDLIKSDDPLSCRTSLYIQHGPEFHLGWPSWRSSELRRNASLCPSAVKRLSRTVRVGGSRLDVKKKWEVFHTLLVFVSISFPELSYGSISFHQFSIIVPCSYIYTYMFLCKDMVSCHHRNLEQIEQNRNNNWTHPNVRVHCRPRCCIVGPNLGWLWRKSVPPSWWWIK
jgi:hypothetical protein